MSAEYDVLVVGAGPAGLAAGIELSRNGWQVLLIDKSAFPRDKVCGGFIGPENKDVLNHYGVLDAMIARGAQKVTHIQLSAPGGKSVHVPLRYRGKDDFGLGFSRRNMDELLLEEARRGGVTFLASAVIAEIARQDGFKELILKRTNGEHDLQVRVRHIIYANGAGPVPQGSGSKLFGVAGLFDSCRDRGSDVIMHFIDQGHVGINAFEDGVFNVCYVIKDKLFKRCQGKYERIWEHLMDSNPNLNTQMRSAKLVGKWKGVCIDLARPLRFFDGDAFYAGDAVGLIHPVAGGGISIALNSGIMLGLLLGHQRPGLLDTAVIARRYEAMWRMAFERSVMVSKWIGSLSHCAPVADILVKILKAREERVHQLFDVFHQPAFLLPVRRTYEFHKNS